MSRITNTNPPNRGDKLTSTDLNTSFTEVNNAFPMDAENVRNEGLDQPSFALAGTSGQSGIILIKADENDNSVSVIVNANTVAGAPPFDAPTTVQTWTTGIVPFNQNKIIRVYWQFENVISGISSIASTTNGISWAVWLEWQLSSGGAFVPVPFQSDFEDIQISPATYGASSLKTYASTFVNHTYVRSGGYDLPPARTGYGCWLFKADQNYVIYGLRLRARGLLTGEYNATPVSGDPVNMWRLVQSLAGQITINKSYMAYMIMEEQ